MTESIMSEVPPPQNPPKSGSAPDAPGFAGSPGVPPVIESREALASGFPGQAGDPMRGGRKVQAPEGMQTGIDTASGIVGGGVGTPSSGKESSQPDRESTEERKASLEMVKEFAKEQNIPPEVLAKSSAGEGFGKDETKEMLTELYGDETAKNVMENQDVKKAFDEEPKRREGEAIQVHPAPTREEQEEVQAGLDARQVLQQAHADVASGKMTKEDGKAKVEEVKNRGLNWNKLGKFTLYGGAGTILGSILLFILLLSWHGGSGGR